MSADSSYPASEPPAFEAEIAPTPHTLSGATYTPTPTPTSHRDIRRFAVWFFTLAAIMAYIPITPDTFTTLLP